MYTEAGGGDKCAWRADYEQQIPGGNDRKKGKSKGKDTSKSKNKNKSKGKDTSKSKNKNKSKGNGAKRVSLRAGYLRRVAMLNARTRW
jgi:hypothetical protein